MRALRAVFLREFGEWKALLPASLIAGLLPFLFALLPGFLASPREVRDASALFLSSVLGGLFALVLGGAVPARDLSEGRAGFYFSRPAPAWAIWAGRLGALASLAFLSWFLVLLPSSLAGGGIFTVLESPAVADAVRRGPLWHLQLVIPALLFLVVLAQAISVLVASRSPWLVLDAGLFIAGATTAGFSLWRLFTRGGAKVFPAACIGLAVLALLALLAAGAAATVLGRADLQRARKALSWTLWPLFLAAALSLEGYSRWFVSPDLGSLTGVEWGVAAPTGPWVLIEGPTRMRPGLAAAFLLDARSGRSVRWPGAHAWAVAFSADGSVCAGLTSHLTARGEESEVTVFDLTSDPLRPRGTGITAPEGFANIALSPDGKRLALFNENRLTVHDLSSGEVLYARTERGAFRFAGRFLGPDRLRLYRWHYQNLATPEGTVDILELDPVTKSLDRIGGMEGVGLDTFQANASCSRLLIRESLGAGWTFSLRDGATGERIATLVEGATGGWGAFVSSGDLVLAYKNAEGRQRRIARFGPGGSPEKEVTLPPEERVLLGEECAPGLLAVGAFPTSGEDRWNRGSLRILDAATLSFRTADRALHPFQMLRFGARGLSDATPVPGSDGTRLFTDGSGNLIYMDPASGDRRVVFKRG